MKPRCIATPYSRGAVKKNGQQGRFGGDAGALSAQKVKDSTLEATLRTEACREVKRNCDSSVAILVT